VLKTNWFLMPKNPKRTPKRGLKPPFVRPRAGIREPQGARSGRAQGGLHEFQMPDPVAKACHSEESAILIGGRRGISHSFENTQSELPRPTAQSLRATGRSARNDSLEGFFRSLLGTEDGGRQSAVRRANPKSKIQNCPSPQSPAPSPFSLGLFTNWLVWLFTAGLEWPNLVR